MDPIRMHMHAVRQIQEILTFFLGWLTSSFIEAHLLRVFKRLEDKH